MTPLGKYIWLIKLLQESDGLTFEEINEAWLRSRRHTEDENMPILKRTFHNHIKAIRDEYGINIECGKGYKYYIADSKEVRSQIERLSQLGMMSEIVTGSKLRKNVFTEDNFDIFRDRKVMPTMDAIKTRHKVKFANFRNEDKPDKYIALNVAPYQLHYLCSQWYVVGQTDEYGLMRIPLSYYRRGGVHLLDDSYEYPANYSSKNHNMILYGSTKERIQLKVKISSVVPEYLCLNEIPLPFQQEVEYKNTRKEIGPKHFYIDNYARISFDLPKTPFALYCLKNKIEKYRYKILNDTNPFTLFSEEEYWDAVNIPTIL